MRVPPWLHTGWSTHRGRRPINEDAVIVDGSLLAVADGVGGAPRGDLASVEAIDTVRSAIEAHEQPSEEPGNPAAAGELVGAIERADDAVKDLSRRWSELRGTATTMCAALVYLDAQNRPHALVANVGDSRCYLVRDGETRQVTVDQTLAVRLAQAGVDDIAERASHIVVSILGGSLDSRPEIDLYGLALRPGDSLVLCTDGVSDVVEPGVMASLCGAFRRRPDMTAAALVRSAWDSRSGDNLTAAVAHIDERLDPAGETPGPGGRSAPSTADDPRGDR
ncbi:MAG: PP2C family protein-serine/threonine phosphatase [Acidimicrobiales bacterium]